MRFCLLVVLVFLALPDGAARSENDSLIDLLAGGGHVALLRHARAPGTGDPAGFDLKDCATQRNLSDTGRNQARLLGERFRRLGMDRARVLSSAWCRCLETAELLGLGPVERLPALNSFFRARERRDVQTQDLLAWIEGADLSVPTILVTHQVNITAVTGGGVASGEVILMRREDAGGLVLVGSLRSDPE